MATKTSLTKNQKIALGVGAVVLIGGIAYLVLKGKGKVVVTASSSNPSAVTPSNEPILTNGNWNISQTVATDGSSTVTINFQNVSTWLPEAGTMTAILFPYPLVNWSLTKNTTDVSTNQLLDPGDYGMGALTFLGEPGGMGAIAIQGGTKAVISGTLVVTGTVPAAYRPSSAATKTSSGTYG